MGNGMVVKFLCHVLFIFPSFFFFFFPLLSAGGCGVGMYDFSFLSCMLMSVCVYIYTSPIFVWILVSPPGPLPPSCSIYIPFSYHYD